MNLTGYQLHRNEVQNYKCKEGGESVLIYTNVHKHIH